MLCILYLKWTSLTHLRVQYLRWNRWPKNHVACRAQGPMARARRLNTLATAVRTKWLSKHTTRTKSNVDTVVGEYWKKRKLERVVLWKQYECTINVLAIPVDVRTHMGYTVDCHGHNIYKRLFTKSIGPPRNPSTDRLAVNTGMFYYNFYVGKERWKSVVD